MRSQSANTLALWGSLASCVPVVYRRNAPHHVEFPHSRFLPNRMDRNGGQAGMFFENPEVRSVIQNWTLDPIRFSQGGCTDASQMAVWGQ
jgi:hypothetical protein